LDQRGFDRHSQASRANAEVVGNNVWLTDWYKRRNNVRPVAGKRLRILALRLPLSDLFLLERLGKTHAWEVRFTTSAGAGFRLASQSHFELILCDCNQAESHWRGVIERIAASSPRSCILLVSPVRDDYLRRDVLQRGGHDVLVRPLREESALYSVQAVSRLVSSENRVSVDC
jgi:CheY-like chemotaxis protein